MTAKNKVIIRIAGKDYTLVGTEPDEYIHKVGLYIDKKMNEILLRNSSFSTSLAAVLTAINVADDYFKSKTTEMSLAEEKQELVREMERLKNEVSQLTQQNEELSAKNTSLQVELAKREAELGEVRNSISRDNRVIAQKSLSEYDM
ncbi:MAG TPA: cell division protein ZapA [Ruminiclostridium sp.]|nr:cell division protein ZapA [Ruminiclostridium sp.]